MTKRILVVDDNADMRKMLLCALAPIAEIAEAASGAAALSALTLLKPALILLDVSMPEMSGLEVLASVHELAPSTLVVMLTGESDLVIAKKALELGARSYITKPFDVDVVLAEVSRLLEGMMGGGPTPYRPWRVAT